MAKCKNCNNLYNLSDEHDILVGKWCPKIVDCPDVEIERECIFYKAMTNADKIRAMSDEELAYIIMCPYDTDRDSCRKRTDCYGCCLKWLQEKVEE